MGGMVMFIFMVLLPLGIHTTPVSGRHGSESSMEWVDEVILHTESHTVSFNTSDPFNRSIISEGCSLVVPLRYINKLLEGNRTMREWGAFCTVVTMIAVIFITVVGNFVVICSIFSYPPLRIVQNFFIVSLAVADLTVAILVMPVYVVLGILGGWVFPGWMCKMWLTCDVMCCTASILNMCAIALDRYRAIADPVNYAQKRTLKRVLLMIALVWVLSFLISSPPLMGWNDWPDVFEPDTPCHLTSQPGYVIYSALGSFYIPLFIMGGTYLKIFTATKRWLRERARAIEHTPMHRMVRSTSDRGGNLPQVDQESIRSGNSHNELSGSSTPGEMKRTRRKKEEKRCRKNEDVAQAPVNQLLVPCSHPPGIRTPTDPLDTNTASTSSQPIEAEHTGGGSPRNPPAQDTCIVFVQPQPPKRSTLVFQLLEEKQRISVSKERRAARTLGITMGVFVVCWMPFFLMYVIRPFCPTCCPSDKLVSFITWLGYINSALNPIIYTIFNIDFRLAVKKLVNRCFTKCFMT